MTTKGFLTLLCFLGATAHADMMKRAYLNLKCTTDAGHVYHLATLPGDVSELRVDGKLVSTGGPLSAGTEGGAPYLQYVRDGYNVTISGGDFEQAFQQQSPRTGTTFATIWTREFEGPVEATCKGFMVFEGQ